MRKAKNLYCIGTVLFLLFILYTLLVKYVDVAAIGPQGSEVGLASINGPISQKLPFNSVFYTGSKYLGYVGIATCALFGMFGVMQLFFKKSLLKVDKDIIFLGGFYVVMLLVYIFFEKVVINYRPVIMDEGLEASYPSSHTMLAVGFITVAIAQFRARLRNKTARIIINTVLAIVMVLMVVSRIISGVHWITDIIGGVLIAESIAVIYCGILAQIVAKKKKKKHVAKTQSHNQPKKESKDKPVETKKAVDKSFEEASFDTLMIDFEKPEKKEAKEYNSKSTKTEKSETAKTTVKKKDGEQKKNSKKSSANTSAKKTESVKSTKTSSSKTKQPQLIDINRQ